MTINRLFRYCMVGAGGTIAHYLILVALVSAGRTDPVTASSAGALAGSVVNYGLNYRFTFNSSESHVRAGPRFLAVAVAGFLLNGLAMVVLVGKLHAHYLVAQVGATALVLGVTFLANSIWSFRSGS